MTYIDRIENEASKTQQTKASSHAKFDARPLLDKITLVFLLNHQNEYPNQTYITYQSYCLQLIFQ